MATLGVRGGGAGSASRRVARRWRLFAVPGLILVVWATASALHVFPEYTLPSVLTVLRALGGLLLSGEILIDVAASLVRVVAGTTLAMLLGIPLGLMIGYRRTVSDLTELPLHSLRPIPPLAWVPFALIWFGGGFGSSVFLVFLGAFFPITLATLGGVRAVEKGHIEVARTLGLNGARLMWKVVVPAALPFMLNGVRVGAGVAWMTVVAAEYFGQSHGLGARIIQSYNLLRMDQVAVAMAFLGMVGFAMDLGIRAVSRRLVKWRPT